MAEVDGNRTRRTGIARSSRFEGGGAHQVPRHLRRRLYRRRAPTEPCCVAHVHDRADSRFYPVCGSVRRATSSRDASPRAVHQSAGASERNASSPSPDRERHIVRTIMRDLPEDLWIDANGVPTERVRPGREVLTELMDSLR